MKELRIDKKPIITVFNKIDLVADKSRLRALKDEFEGCFLISAKRGLFLDELKHEIINYATKHLITANIKVNLSEQKSLASIYEWAQVLNREYVDGYVELQLRYPITMRRKFNQLVESGNVLYEKE